MADDFFATLRAAVSPALRARLDRETVNGWDAAARKAHPGVKLTPQRFAGHLALHLTPEVLDDPKAWLPSDLFLAAACLASDPKALGQLDQWLRRGRRGDDVVQRSRERLLVGAQPKLMQYAGRGALQAWVGLVAKRVAIDVRREEPTEPHGTPLTLASAIKGSPELRLVRADGAKKVSTALKAALARLDARDRQLVRGHYLEGKSHAELAEQLGTARSTVALWLEKARQRLLAETQAALTGMDDRDRESLIQAVKSHLDLSFSELAASRSRADD